MVAAAKNIKGVVTKIIFHKFSPQGVTGVVTGDKLHLTIHTWPEYAFAAVDIFTCSTLQPSVAADYLIDKFESKDSTILTVERGIC